MIKVPSYLDFISKLANFLGVDFDENANKTDKCRIKELREFNQQVDEFKRHYLPKFCDVLAGDDLDKRQAIESFSILIESLMRFLCDKNYYTLANEKRGMWALLIFYYIPQMASMISIYKKEFGIPQNLVSNGFMLPIMEANKLVTPTSLLRKYLKEIVRSTLKHDRLGLDFGNYIADLKSNITPRHKTKFKITNEIDEKIKNKSIKNPENLKEIESIIDCAIFSSHVYQELCRYFKDKQQAYMLIEYFRKCLDICDKGLIDATDNIQLPEEFKAFVLSHLDYTINELYYTKAERKSYGRPRDEKLKNNRDKCRSYFFHSFASYLYETKSSEADILEDVDINGLYEIVLKYNPDHMISSSDKEHDDIVNLLYRLKYIFRKPKNDLNEKEIINVLEAIKRNKYFMNYEHEFLYYNALNYLAKNDFSKAIEQLKLARKKCKKITAGETAVSASNLLIVLRLLSENTISYSHLNPEIQTIIDSQPEEVISRPLQNSSEDEAHKTVYLDKTIKLIEEFNANGYCCYHGFTCEKYNPLEKLESFLSDFFERYDDEKYLSETEEIKIQKIIKALVKGSNAKYNLKKPIVAMFQFTIIEAFQDLNMATIGYFYSQSKLSSKSMDKLFSSDTTLQSLIQAIENL